MSIDARRSQIEAVFADVSENEKQLIDKLIDEVVFLESRMLELRKMPFISVHPNNPALQRTTAAAKQYKECSQSYMNAIRILLSVLAKVDSEGQAELLRKLEEFSL